MEQHKIKENEHVMIVEQEMKAQHDDDLKRAREMKEEEVKNMQVLHT